MKILFVTETLYPRGAETFLVRLANALCKHHSVIILNLHPFYSRTELISKVDPSIKLISRKQTGRKFVEKIDGAFIRLRLKNSLSATHIIRSIRDAVIEHKVDVVHSHLFKADNYTALARTTFNLSFNHVTTNHGDYVMFDQLPPKRIVDFRGKLDFTLQHVDHVVNISADQVILFTQWKKQNGYKYSLHEIANGYEGELVGNISRKQLEIPEESFVFGMVGSGIAEKGWDYAIKAFKALNAPNAKLLLIGEGHRLEELTIEYKNDQQIIFTGLVKNPLDYIALFDVGMLPSYYAAESLPTVIIEYLYMKKPIIATDIGEIKKMLQVAQGSDLAGTLIRFEQHREIEEQLKVQMGIFLNDPQLLKDLADRTASAFEKFGMDKCLKSYTQVYSNSTSN